MNGLDCLKWLVPGDTDASWQRMTDAAAGMGFDKVVLIVLPFSGASFDLARKWSSGVPGWTALYRQRQFDRVDPMLRHCFRSALPLVWDDALFALPEQRPCYEAAAAYGMRSGVVLPVRGAKGEVGMLLCASTDELAATREHCDRHLAALTLLRDVACEAIAGTRCHAPPDSVPRLSRREVECLRWHAAGKTSWEIGHILNVTESCINFHFMNIRRKFNVSRRHEAVLRAVEWGLISISDVTVPT
ncbi:MULTISPECIES: autoinducer binding domain-containing protein [Burkholderia]|uniref:LuxR family transcriptional regulator n=3 Tax=Burkholderia TaxID=32008 RepID=A0AAE8NL83_BURCE|nr:MULTISPECIES: autoinducer binding domain-containing protein [Burkholderia]KAB1587474.1 hypothetical protein C5O75_029590 [Burkholderia cepacia]MBA9895606.1 hypothetical protein [Burkholderia cepacia]MBA9942141.1 hypothetical protein [Burkholderia cepacia]MBA9972129.1 hypothetical protein [Burkholderia cepacia]MBA9990701.1 hypothetical protein [Burkholderia cepacia]